MVSHSTRPRYVGMLWRELSLHISAITLLQKCKIDPALHMQAPALIQNLCQVDGFWQCNPMDLATTKHSNIAEALFTTPPERTRHTCAVDRHTSTGLATTFIGVDRPSNFGCKSAYSDIALGTSLRSH